VVPERFAPILAELAPLTERFAAAGKRLYLVGGTVRDLLIGRGDVSNVDAFDFDATTDARPEETKKIVSGWADAV
jgi:poly(A) polymerase